MRRYLAILMLLALALTGCKIRLDASVTVNEDETGSFAFFYGMDEEFQQAIEEGGAEDPGLLEGFEGDLEGWTVEEVTEEGFDGARISTSFDSIDDLRSKMESLGEDPDSLMSGDLFSEAEFVRDGDEFRFKIDVTGLDEQLTGAMGDGGGDEDLLSGMDPDTILQQLFEIRFKLTLPGEIKSHNADSVDGNTLIWNVALSDAGGTYEAVSSVGGGNSALLYGGIAIAALVVIGVGVAATRRRKDQAKADAVAAAPVTSDPQPFDPID